MKLISFSPFISLILTLLLVVAPLSAQTVETLQLRLVESDGPQISASSQAVKGFTVEVRDSAGNVVPDAAIAFRLPENGATGIFADGTHAAVAYTDSLGRAHVGELQWSATPGPVALRVTATKGTAHAGILIEQTLTSTSATQSEPEASAPLSVKQSHPEARVQQQPGMLAKPSLAPPSVSAKEPVVSVTGSGQATSHSKAKWIAIVAVIAGAGAGAAMALGKGKSNTSAPAPSDISIGSPTISVGPGH